MKKEYVGDGVYVEVGNFIGQIVVTTEDGISVQNTIYLESSMVDFLVNYLKRSMKEKQ